SMSMLGQNVVYVGKWPWGGGDDYEWWEYRSRREMKLDYISEIRESSRLASSVSGAAQRRTPIQFQDASIEGVSTVGVTDQYFETAGLSLAQGRAFTGNELRSGSKVVVLGATIVDNLFEFGNAIGKEVRIGGQQFLVIGILEKQGKFLGLEDMDRRAIVPIKAYGQIFSLRRGIQIAI